MTETCVTYLVLIIWDVDKLCEMDVTQLIDFTFVKINNLLISFISKGFFSYWTTLLLYYKQMLKYAVILYQIHIFISHKCLILTWT